MANPDEEFEFFLASKLGRTVAELREDMSADEFMRWGVYYGREAQRAEMAAKTPKKGGGAWPHQSRSGSTA